MKSSLLITLEGMEGCGKTTQARLLAHHLRKRGFKVFLTYEPGGTEIGKAIRRILLNPMNKNMDRYTELFLYLAERAQHLKEIIIPQLKEKAIIVCDRFYDATYAYQGYARGIPQSFIKRCHSIGQLSLKPDLTILLDIKEHHGLKRAQKRDQLKKASSEGRFEEESFIFHKKVRQGYLTIAQREKRRVKIIDGSRSIEKVHQEIVHLVDQLLDGK